MQENTYKLMKGFKTCPKCKGLGLKISKNGIARPCDKCDCMGYTDEGGKSIYNGDEKNEKMQHMRRANIPIRERDTVGSK